MWPPSLAGLMLALALGQLLAPGHYPEVPTLTLTPPLLPLALSGQEQLAAATPAPCPRTPDDALQLSGQGLGPVQLPARSARGQPLQLGLQPARGAAVLGVQCG